MTIPETTSDHPILRVAEFDPKVKAYWTWGTPIVLACTIVMIPVAIIYLIVAQFFVDKWLARLSCVLTERTLEIKKGVLSRTESTVPLEKITDLMLYQGPIMRWLGIHGFRIETAGQMIGAGTAEGLIGIINAPEFRKAVLAQRDKLARLDDDTPRRTADASPQDPETITVLRDIRDTLTRIETKLDTPTQAHGSQSVGSPTPPEPST